MWDGFGWCEGTVVRGDTGSGERAKGAAPMVHSDGVGTPTASWWSRRGRDKEWVLIDEAGEWEERADPSRQRRATATATATRMT